MLKSVLFSETSLFLETAGTIYGAMICAPGNQCASVIMQGPLQSPCELWFSDLHGPSMQFILTLRCWSKLGCLTELETSCHLSFSCKVFWYSFHWFFWGPHLLKYLFTFIKAWSIVAIGTLLFLSATWRKRVCLTWLLRGHGQIHLKHRNFSHLYYGWDSNGT